MSWVLGLALVAGQGGDPTFTDVRIEPPFDKYLRANPLLMETAGAKVIRREDGSRVVLAVACTPVRDGSAEDRQRALTVCKTRALAALVSETQGVQVAHVEKAEKETRVVLDNGKEEVKSVSRYLQVTRSQVEGWTRAFPVVGRWKSADGGLYYLAIGGIIDDRGRRIDTVP